MAERSRRTVYRFAFGATALLVLATAVSLPLSVAGVMDDLLGSSVGGVLRIAQAPRGTDASTHLRVHVSIVKLDEVQLVATLRVAGHLICDPDPCGWSNRLVFFSLTDDDDVAEGMPPSAGVDFPSSRAAVSQLITLPIRGEPIHYPFDKYRLNLGVVMERVFPDGTVLRTPPDEAAKRLSLTVQELLPREVMVALLPIAPSAVHRPDDPVVYLHVQPLEFERQPYLRVLAVLLVVLIAAAAAYATFLRPLQELLVNVGALVLGVWGIRAILIPANVEYVTAVDLSLSIVIIFLLGAITVKALLFVHDEGGLRVLRRRLRREEEGQRDAETRTGGEDAPE